MNRSSAWGIACLLATLAGCVGGPQPASRRVVGTPAEADDPDAPRARPPADPFRDPADNATHLGRYFPGLKRDPEYVPDFGVEPPDVATAGPTEPEGPRRLNPGEARAVAARRAPRPRVRSDAGFPDDGVIRGPERLVEPEVGRASVEVVEDHRIPTLPAAIPIEIDPRWRDPAPATRPRQAPRPSRPEAVPGAIQVRTEPQPEPAPADPRVPEPAATRPEPSHGPPDPFAAVNDPAPIAPAPMVEPSESPAPPSADPEPAAAATVTTPAQPPAAATVDPEPATQVLAAPATPPAAPTTAPRLEPVAATSSPDPEPAPAEPMSTTPIAPAAPPALLVEPATPLASPALPPADAPDAALATPTDPGSLAARPETIDPAIAEPPATSPATLTEPVAAESFAREVAAPPMAPVAAPDAPVLTQPTAPAIEAPAAATDPEPEPVADIVPETAPLAATPKPTAPQGESEPTVVARDSAGEALLVEVTAPAARALATHPEPPAPSPRANPEPTTAAEVIATAATEPAEPGPVLDSPGRILTPDRFDELRLPASPERPAPAPAGATPKVLHLEPLPADREPTLARVPVERPAPEPIAPAPAPRRRWSLGLPRWSLPRLGRDGTSAQAPPPQFPAAYYSGRSEPGTLVAARPEAPADVPPVPTPAPPARRPAWWADQAHHHHHDHAAPPPRPTQLLEETHRKLRGAEPAAAPPRPARSDAPWWRPRLLERFAPKPAPSGGAAEAGDLAEGR